VSKRLTAVVATCMVSAIAAAAAHATTITSKQFARQADTVCSRDYKAQAALGPGLVNADDVTRAHLPRAAAYLDKIVAITNTEISHLAALPATTVGMTQRHALTAALRRALADERDAAASHKGDLAALRAALERLIVHGYPTGPDYRAAIRAFKATAPVFPFKTCGRGSAIYP
jgi:hypothetical protein